MAQVKEDFSKFCINCVEHKPFTNEEIILAQTSPTIFKYSGKQNANLFIALRSISSAFRERNIEFSANEWLDILDYANKLKLKLIIKPQIGTQTGIEMPGASRLSP